MRHRLEVHPFLPQRGATEAAEAARIFEGQLAGALVAEDGQLALSNLAASAAHGFMPKIQTQGQLGQARWRLVSAPSIPGGSRPTRGVRTHTAFVRGQKVDCAQRRPPVLCLRAISLSHGSWYTC